MGIKRNFLNTMFTGVEITEKVKEKVNSGSLPRIVCFDYFDTLVTRKVYPEATKKLAARNLAMICGESCRWQTLYELRAGIEKKLCKESVAAGFDAEFTINDLGEELFSILQHTGWLPDWMDGKTFLTCFISTEIAVEKNVQESCYVLTELLKFLHKKQYEIYIVSDFYFSRKQFRLLLEYHGISKCIHGIFTSADNRLSKGGTGRLYEKIISRLSCNAEEILMIGDNRRADYDMAVNRGLQAIHLDRGEQYEKYRTLQMKETESNLENDTLSSEFMEILEEQKVSCFGEMGLTLWYFIRKLFVRLNNDSVHDVFFCSKEGEFLRKLFIQFQILCFGREIIRSHYLLVSRKATFICSLDSLEKEDFSRLFAHYRDISFKEFLLSLNFSVKTAKKICELLELPYNTRIQDLEKSFEFQSLVSSDIFRDFYEIHRVEQKKHFLSYLESFGKEAISPSFTMVDVGWKGSIQNNIRRCLPEDIVVNGYYIGLLSPTEVTETNRKHGVLFSDVPVHSPFIHVFNNNRSLFEMLLGATHGSADGYFDEKVFADEKDHRKSLAFSHSGKNDQTVVSVLDLPEERKLFKEKIEPLQGAYLQMNRELTKAFSLSLKNSPDLQWFAERHARMVFFPEKREVIFFSMLYHLENFGLFEFTDFQVTGDISFSRKVKNLRLLLKDPAMVLETGVWQPVILRRLGLEFLQPLDGRKRFKRIFS